MVFSAPAIELDEEGRTGVTVRYANECQTSVPRVVFLTGPWILSASEPPAQRTPGRKDSTHVPFWRNLPRKRR